MKVMLDIGNTRTKYVIKQGDFAEQIQTIENVKLTATWLSKNWQNARQILIANVNKSTVTQALTHWATENRVTLTNVESESERFGIHNCYDNPTTLGVDRWLTLIGGNRQYPNKNILIIDSGTATTIDFLTSNGEHQGGWILPGIDTLFASILTKTSKVDAAYISSASISLGKNTSECVNSACWAATVGLINVAIAQIRHTKVIDEIILLGGNAKSLTNFLNEAVIIDQYLIFSGLERYFIED